MMKCFLILFLCVNFSCSAFAKHTWAPIVMIRNYCTNPITYQGERISSNDGRIFTNLSNTEFQAHLDYLLGLVKDQNTLDAYASNTPNNEYCYDVLLKDKFNPRRVYNIHVCACIHAACKHHIPKQKYLLVEFRNN